jgi:hypothetical protein
MASVRAIACPSQANGEASITTPPGRETHYVGELLDELRFRYSLSLGVHTLRDILGTFGDSRKMIEKPMEMERAALAPGVIREWFERLEGAIVAVPADFPFNLDVPPPEISGDGDPHSIFTSIHRSGECFGSAAMGIARDQAVLSAWTLGAKVLNFWLLTCGDSHRV